MLGGRLLGQGTYGCVFSPPLLCASKTGSQKRAVGKLTVKEDADKEIAVANKLRQMPLVSNYFILPYPESCIPKEKQAQTEKELDLCVPTTRQNDHRLEWQDAKQIFEPYGGNQSFYSILNSTDLHPSRFDFYSFMRHLLEAGSLLVKAGVCHFDLHPNNLLVDEKGVVRILDLGQAFLSKEITDDVPAERWKELFFGIEKNQGRPHDVILSAEPPEVSIMNGIRNSITPENAIAYTAIGKPVFGDIERYLGVSRKKSQAEMLQFWKTSGAAVQGDWTKMFQLYWPGFDAWSIGSILLLVLKTQLTWPQFTEGDWKVKKTAVLQALRGLLHASPRERMDCMEALVVFDPGNLWIEKFGKEWLEKREKQRAGLLVQKDLIQKSP
jgi:serine/threonine protein kinase